MGKKTFFVMMFCQALTALADDYNFLTIESSDGNKDSLPALVLKLTFTDDELVATSGTATTTFDLSTLSVLRFSLSDDSEDAAIGAVDSSGDITPSTADAIFDLNGRRVAEANLKKGVYILKKGNRTVKTIIP